MGVRLGQSTTAAEQEIRKRMKVASVYDLPNAKHHFIYGAFGCCRPELWPVEFGGRLYVDVDGSEIAAVMTVPNLPGRVFTFGYASLVTAGLETQVEAELIKENGEPTYHKAGVSNHDFWGIAPDNRGACLLPWGAPALDEWHRVEGSDAVVTKMSPNIENEEFGREYGLYGKMQMLLYSYSSNDKETMYRCPSFLFASFEQTKPRDTYSTKFLGAPALVNGTLLDPALLRWYELQQEQ
jgi:hypothetical protein